MKASEASRQAAETGERPRVPVLPLAERPWMTILHRPADETTVGPPVVVFNAYLYDREARTDFIGTIAGMRRPAYFISDLTNTWFARPQMVETVTRVLLREFERTGVTECDTLGFSMGAYGALAYASLLPVRHVMAMAPRFSADPAIVRAGPRRKPLRRLSGRLAFPTIEEGMRAARGGLVMHGMRGFDRVHWPLFPRDAAPDHWLLPGCAHMIPQHLRRYDQLEAVIAAGLDGDRDEVARLLRPFWAVRPGSRGASLHVWPAYMHDMAKRTAKRILGKSFKRATDERTSGASG